MARAPGKIDADEFLSGPVSIYLDLVRFLSAFAVLVGHCLQDGLYTGRYLFGTAAHEAVIVFFVLSGLVITTTTMRPGQTARTFFIARAARIYPVVLAALVLSFGLYALAGVLGFNAPGWAEDAKFTFSTTVLSLLFLNESWVTTAVPWNPPYWSICYEVFYYALFACLLFGRGVWRWPLLAALALLAGPRILALAPVWALGVWVVLDSRLRLRNPALGMALVSASWAAVFVIDAVRLDELVQDWLYATIPGWWRLYNSQKLVTDYLLGLLVAANFIGFHACAPWFAGQLQRIEGLVRFLAGSTFSLYLFHRPITKFLSAAGVSAGTDVLAFTGLLVGIMTLCFMLAAVTEKRRAEARRVVTALLNRLLPARRPAEAELV